MTPLKGQFTVYYANPTALTDGALVVDDVLESQHRSGKTHEYTVPAYQL